jgi:hypothetical protein
MPNLIHSLDACSLALLVKLIRDEIDKKTKNKKKKQY